MGRNLLLAAALVLFPLCLSAQTVRLERERICGQEREILLYLPDGLAKGAPLVFLLHRGGPIREDDPCLRSLQKAARTYGFALCIPQGLPDGKGVPSWNVGYPFQDNMKTDDVKVVEKMAGILQRKYTLSRENTFLTGHSNGGEMCYLMAFSGSKTFRAIASLSGLLMCWIYQGMSMQRPVPFMEMHGSIDMTSMIDGDLEGEGGWGAYMPVKLAVSAVAAADRCLEEKVEKVEGMDPDGPEIVRHRFIGGSAGTEVWYYEIIGGDHSVGTYNLDAGEHIWQFFSKYIVR